MKRRPGMLSAANFSLVALVALWALTIPMRADAQYSNLEIPTAADGYSITTTLNTSENAPAGYTGHIEKMEQLAVGKEPSVIGRTYKSRFVLSMRFATAPRRTARQRAMASLR
jgi:hypothetical protein